MENNEPSLDRINNKLKFQLLRKNIWVASSTHNNEEIFCAKTHIELKKKIKNLLTIIIPRHIHRVNQIFSEMKKLDLKVMTHSSNERNLRDIDIILLIHLPN